MDIEDFSEQNRWVIVAYNQPNINVIEEFMNLLSYASKKVCIWTNAFKFWAGATKFTISPAC